MSDENDNVTRCRTCFRADNKINFVDVFSPQGLKMKLKSRIQAQLHLNINEVDCFPKAICIKCIAYLDSNEKYRAKVNNATELWWRTKRRNNNKRMKVETNEAEAEPNPLPAPVPCKVEKHENRPIPNESDTDLDDNSEFENENDEDDCYIVCMWKNHYGEELKPVGIKSEPIKDEPMDYDNDADHTQEQARSTTRSDQVNFSFQEGTSMKKVLQYAEEEIKKQGGENYCILMSKNINESATFDAISNDTATDKGTYISRQFFVELFDTKDQGEGVAEAERVTERNIEPESTSSGHEKVRNQMNKMQLRILRDVFRDVTICPTKIEINTLLAQYRGEIFMNKTDDDIWLYLKRRTAYMKRKSKLGGSNKGRVSNMRDVSNMNMEGDRDMTVVYYRGQ